MEQLRKRVAQLVADVNNAAAGLDLDEKQAELKELERQINQPDFWQDNQKAQEVSKQEASLSRRISPWLKLREAANELQGLVELNDEAMEPELKKQYDDLSSQFDDLKADLRFRGPFDDHDVILGIYAGAGGTDAQDWAQMLLRMYLRWAEQHKLKVETIDQSSGEEAGIKSATVKITDGDFLYGKLSGEHGVHRLVRLSPFNADNLRQTSFAKVEVLPAIDQPSELLLDDKDLKIDVYRAGGHGGQSVNTTDSAVRVTYLPTGITVAIQNERSQIQNKEKALNILRSKLVQLQLEQHAEDLAGIKGPSQSAEWGNQIRNYVLHPYKQVKDNRSGYESSDPLSVLDGKLDPMIEAWLQSKSGK